MTENFLAQRRALIGKTAYSDWLTVDQSMIDQFANATLDRQFIHVDPVKAAQTPFGGTIAHGFLTLSLISHLAVSVPGLLVDGLKMSVNYGFDKVRFVNPARSGSRVRAGMTLADVQEKRPGQFEQYWTVVIEIEGIDKPAMTAVWIVHFFV